MQNPPARSIVDKAALKRRIERLNVSADIKLLLENLLEITHTVGSKIVQVGAKILESIFDFAKAYPNIALGVAAALVISFLINSIPLLGPALSTILTPLLLILGIGLGALNDLTDSSMKLSLDGIEAAFRGLSAQ
ncbi:MAG: hypothetical protein C0481_15370 [Phenylobacterium sp.]|uniref:hypothetical protein n=1 Tax=Phenylobacterium sp. TaxID=1871053 RepID=UPI0025D894C8|nr:hypothetical protein [Phenylobacterium sp.]MBA4013245.1 hypothetical protein [Phenylobacterium sp.]